MTEELNKVYEDTKSKMDKAIEHLESELLKVRAGKANPSMLDSVVVDYYGNPTPINQVANISTPDAKTISIQPWEKTMLDEISTAIINGNLGFTPQNNGEMLIISMPPLTEERRKELSKKVRAEAENAKVSIRNVRKDANDAIKKLQKDGLPEDVAKGGEEEVQKFTKNYSEKSDQLADLKEADLMKI